MTVLALVLAVTLVDTSTPVVATLSDGARVVWQRGEDPELRALPLAGEGWYRVARRLTGDGRTVAALRQANPNLKVPLRDVRVRVPWALLSPKLKVAALRALFPDDRRTAEGWRHRVRAPWGGDGESWLELARWWCGDERVYAELRDANPYLSLFTAAGDELLIPAHLLLPVIRALPVEEASPTPTPVPPTPTPVPPTPTPVPPTAIPVPSIAAPAATPTVAGSPAPTVAPVVPTGEVVRRGATPAAVVGSAAVARQPRGELEYLDAVAVYRLKAGEALYSAVVVRFTGQLHAADVNATAAELAKLSGITDVTDIPIGFPIRIPFEILLPEFLPADHPRRREWERSQDEVAAIRRAIRARNLDGIHVILDAGHGGVDTGAIVKGVWESTYAYDVMDRVRRVLERDTRATVWTTVASERSPRELEMDVLPARRRQRLLVNPPFDLSDSTIGVQLRWVLGNAILRRLQAQRVDAEQVAFVSIHADSLHPSVRGLMVYVPGRAHRPLVGSALPAGHACRELKEIARPRFSGRYLARSEALSRQLARAVVASARRADIPVHPWEPVRPVVVRRESRWVPAVLRNSEAPSALLIEICNLANDEDRAQVLSWRFRDKLAHAIVAGLAEGFAR